jgi:predicted TIM-barrel fold metal-dependent hydrolase
VTSPSRRRCRRASSPTGCSTSTSALQELDACGIEIAALSLKSPGIQGEPDPGRAVELAIEANDRLAEIVARHPTRYVGLAALPLQDPERAVAELERCHLGERLPLAIWRLQNRFELRPHGKTLERPVSAYLRENFHITTSGNFSTRALEATIAELGADRVLFAVDYPYESNEAGASWFDAAPLSDEDRAKIGRENAVRLLGL